MSQEINLIEETINTLELAHREAVKTLVFGIPISFTIILYELYRLFHDSTLNPWLRSPIYIFAIPCMIIFFIMMPIRNMMIFSKAIRSILFNTNGISINLIKNFTPIHFENFKIQDVEVFYSGHHYKCIEIKNIDTQQRYLLFNKNTADVNPPIK